MFCDRCKRTLERLYAELRKESQAPILFHGKFMHGYDCMMNPDKEGVGSHFCIQNFIKSMAEKEEPAGNEPTGKKEIK